MGINGPNLDAYFQVDGVGGGRNRAKSEVEQLPRGGGGPGQDEHAPDINTDHYLLWPLSTIHYYLFSRQWSH